MDTHPSGDQPDTDTNNHTESNLNGNRASAESVEAITQLVTDMDETTAEEYMEFASLLAEYDVKSPERGELLQGIVIGIDKDAIILDVGAKRDAVVPHSDLSRLNDDFADNITVGDELPVYVMRTPNGGEELEVSIRRGLEQQDWLRAEDALESGDILEVPIVDFNKGGLLVDYRQIRGFVPNSHIPALRHISDPADRDQYKAEQIGTTVEAKVIEVNRSRRRLVLSIKAAEKELREDRLQALEPGQVVTGRVSSIADFGAFVDIGGVTGLVHISRLDWRRIEHPSEVVDIGDEIEVLIEKIDPDRERIRLNHQAVLPNPWKVLEEKYQVDDIVEGTVTNIVDFGAFVALDIGVEGLVHISEMPQTGKYSLQGLQKDMTVRARILKIEADRQRLRLSLLHEQDTPEVDIDWDVRSEESESPEEDTTEPESESENGPLENSPEAIRNDEAEPVEPMAIAGEADNDDQTEGEEEEGDSQEPSYA